METRIDKFNESKRMSRVAKNIDLYKEINDTELDNFNVRSNATVIGNQDKEIDVEQIKKILDKRYNSAPRRRSIRIEPQEEVSKISVDDTKEYDLTKVLEKAKDEKVETYEENRAKKLRNTQYDILNNLNLDASDEEVKEEKKIDPEENLMNLINTITINEAKKQESKNDDVDPLDILTDLKGEDDTQVYDSVTTVTKITEIKEKEKEKIDNNKDNNIDNSFYTDNLFKKKDFEEDRVFITAQNHGYYVSEVPECMNVTQINLNDNTVEGMRHKELPVYSVQYHPEACPGPKDSTYVFDKFLELI